MEGEKNISSSRSCSSFSLGRTEQQIVEFFAEGVLLVDEGVDVVPGEGDVLLLLVGQDCSSSRVVDVLVQLLVGIEDLSAPVEIFRPGQPLVKLGETVERGVRILLAFLRLPLRL